MKRRDVGFWWHSIDLGDGTITPGFVPPEQLRHEIDELALPDLHGKSVLDIGAWDGYFSFEAERRGAKRVVALDHYVWSLDLAKQQQHWKDSPAPRPYHEMPEYWDPKRLPGKAGFDTARLALKSKVEDVVADFMAVDLRKLGTFDVVLYLRVLYHIEDPYRAIRRLAQVTNELAVITTEALVVEGHTRPLCEFLESNELNNDPSNWWVPNIEALLSMCRAAGFASAEAIVGPPSGVELSRGDIHRYHAVVHAKK